MEVTFRNTRTERDFREGRRLQSVHGERRARLIMRRLQELRAAQNLVDLWPPFSGPGRCHELTGNRAGQLSLDLDHPYRLLFEPDQDPRPLRPEGGLDWFRVNRVRILGVEDTHE